MKEKIKLLVLLLVLFSSLVQGQWIQTNGIKGGHFAQFHGESEFMIAVTNYGTVFVNHTLGWKYDLTPVNSVSQIIKAGNTWLLNNSNTLLRTDDKGMNWTESNLPFYAYNGIEYTGNLLYGLSADSLFMSTDKGENWTGRKTSDSVYYTDSTGMIRGGFIYAPQKAVIKNNKIYLAGFSTLTNIFSGIFISNLTEPGWQVLPLPSGVSFVQEMAVVDSSIFIAATGSVLKLNNAGVWEEMNAGLPEQFTPTRLWDVEGKLMVIISGSTPGLYIFNGKIWQDAGLNGYPSSVEVNGSSIFATVEGKLKIKNGNNSWTETATDIVASTSQPIPVNRDTVYSLYKGKLNRSFDGGIVWEEKDISVSSLTIGTDHSLNCISTTGLVRSFDAGDSWVVVNGNIPASYIEKRTSLAVLDGILYAGFSGLRARMHLPAVWEQGGVYRSTDGGVSWSTFNTGLPSEGNVYVPVYSIQIVNGKLILKTIKGFYLLTGSGWLSLESGLPQSTSIQDIRYKNGTFYLMTSRGFYLSDEATMSLIPVMNGLPLSSGYNYHGRIFFYKDTLYSFATYLGPDLHKLVDTVWVPADFPLSTTGVTWVVSEVEDILYAGTYDQGIWKYTDNPATGIDEPVSSLEFELLQNYPNPFNPSTTITYSLPKAASVKLRVYDILGKEVALLVDQELDAGVHHAVFDGTKLSSGIYFYELDIQSFKARKKLLLLK